jgi:hypothetical protein
VCVHAELLMYKPKFEQVEQRSQPPAVFSFSLTSMFWFWAPSVSLACVYVCVRVFLSLPLFVYICTYIYPCLPKTPSLQSPRRSQHIHL